MDIFNELEKRRKRSNKATCFYCGLCEDIDKDVWSNICSCSLIESKECKKTWLKGVQWDIDDNMIGSFTCSGVICKKCEEDDNEY